MKHVYGPASDRSTALLEPNLLMFLLRVFDRLRWDDSADLPVMKVPPPSLSYARKDTPMIDMVYDR